MKNPKILLFTPMYEGLWPLIDGYIRYVALEKKHNPNLDLVWFMNNSSEHFIRGVTEYNELNNLGANIIDLGEIADKFDATLISENRAIDMAREGKYDYLMSFEQDNIPCDCPGYTTPMQVLLEQFKNPLVGMVGGSYRFKQMGRMLGSGMTEVPPIYGNRKGDTGMVMAKVNIHSPRVKEQLRRKLNYVDVDGLPFGYTMIRREVFEKYRIPDRKDWHPFGTSDFKFCDMVRKKWRIRLMRNLRVLHLFVDMKKKEIVTF